MRIILTFMLLAACAMGRADTLGVYASVGYWAFDYDGDVLTDVSLDDDFDITKNGSLMADVSFEHPIPMLPNVRLAYSGLDDSSTGVLTRGFNFEGTPFTIGQAVSSELDLTHIDTTLYYELVDLGFDLDLGVTGRFLNGKLSVNGVSEDLTTVVPMVFAHTRIYLPFSGTYLGAVANVGSAIVDYQLKVGWATENFIFPEFGIEAGYRNFDIDDDDDVDLNVDTDGAFISLVAHF